MEKNASCADCGVVNCNAQDKEYPEFCLTTNLDEGVKKEALLEYEKEANKKVSLAAAEVEYEGYCIKTRVEEIMEFAKKLGITKIGIATCVGLIRETHAFAKILRAQGFEVYAVACKVGVVPKVDIGIPEKCSLLGASMCNPILQAKLLNKKATGLNVVIGLCVGHDSLFYKYSDALVTTLVTKDRVLGHNPVAALYQLESYYRKLLK